jgi:hypothetical protein
MQWGPMGGVVESAAESRAHAVVEGIAIAVLSGAAGFETPVCW